MKILLIILLICCTISVNGQDYPFARNFVAGSIIFKDSSRKTGLLQWFPNQNEKVKFRENENASTKKYAAEELIGFSTDTLRFVSLFNFEVYAENYGLLGKVTKIKHAFGQLLDSGSFNIYLVTTGGYNAMAGGIQNYINFLFKKKSDSGYLYAAYPFGIRMKDKRYEQAKEDLYIFFKDYPEILEKIKLYKQENNFFDIIDLMKKSN